MPESAISQIDEQIAERLANSYLNAVGVRSCQFVIKFKKLTPEVQKLVNTKLVALGRPPYDLNASPKRRSSLRQHYKDHIVSKTLTEAEVEQEKNFVGLLNEININKGITQQFLVDLGHAENACRQQLCELRGVPYDNPLSEDPFALFYKPAHTHARHNKEELRASIKCGCFFCRAVFSPKAIVEFTENDTALCPSCGMDSVIGDKTGYELTEEFLLAMFRRWFSVPLKIRAERERDKPPADFIKLDLTILPPDEPAPTPPHLLDDQDLSGVGSKLVTDLPEEEDEEEEW